MLARQRLDLAPQVDVGPGKRRIIVAPRGDRRSQPPDAFDPRRGDRDPQFGGLALQGEEPGRIARAFLEQSVAAAQRALELIAPRAVLRIDREHETIEKAPSLARRTGEQTVHRRGQPDQPDMVGAGGAGGRAGGRAGAPGARWMGLRRSAAASPPAGSTPTPRCRPTPSSSTSSDTAKP